ncbi:MAG TPA: hypothetical protein VH881_12450 [Burkholderiales bacterium]
MVITGTGRSGTTFLVELLTHLGLDTGFTLERLRAKIHKVARAGLEHDIRRENCPYIVKWPAFCDYAEEVFGRSDIAIEHILVPMRDLYSAAESRRFVESNTLSGASFLERLALTETQQELIGGLVGTTSSEPGNQEEVLLRRIYSLLLAVSGTAVPVTFMRYPRIVKDCPYLFEKLKPILRGVTYESFAAVFARTARPDLMHSFSEKDR